MKISILGYGVVGKGVYEMLQACPEHVVCSVLVRQGKAEAEKSWMVESIENVLNDASDAVIECMGGTEPAFEFTSRCLEAGKSVITSNKALVASHGIELMNKALAKNLSFLFSAACGGAIPILQNLYCARQTDFIFNAGGILNGTTNYMLDAMDRFSLSFEEALAQAKTLGYAEADPTADLSGLDTLRKILLLSMVAYDILPAEGYNIEGIQSICATDFGFAKAHDCTLRLIGKTGLSEDGKLYAYVEPVMCKKDSSFSGVIANNNLAFYTGKNSGYMSFGGQGAGRYPTASAVLRDVFSVSSGQRQMLRANCKTGQSFNDSKECENNYIVRCKKETKSLCDSLIPNREIAQERELLYLLTEKIGVKKMHDAAKNIRESGAELFFAQCDEVNL